LAAPLAPAGVPGNDASSALTLAPSEAPAAAATKIRYFGDYELLEEIGRGGMGVVYKARQQSLHRIVALKVLRINGRDDANLHTRFRSEALAVARLQHPNIVQIFEVGEHQGYSYFSLELVEGGNLAQRTRGKQLPEEDAARLILPLARAMHYAHQRGVIHRDLKPANVLLAADGTPKITDFGLAKLARTNRRLTRMGDIIGTPAYMAPEQARGNIEAVGASADVYSLGAILYELLTAQPPFVADSAIATLLLVGTATPKEAVELRPGLSPDLNAICMKCLKKEPAERYATAEALANDLEHLLAGKAVAARPLGPVTKLARWTKRARRRAVAIAAAAVMIGLLVAGGLLYIHRLERDRDAAMRERESALSERDAAIDRAEVAEVWRTESRESARIVRKSMPVIESQLDEAREKARKLEAENARTRQELDEAQRTRHEMRQTLDATLRANYARQLADAAERWLTEPKQVGRLLRDDGRCPQELRDFTWELLSHGRDYLRQSLRGHSGSVHAVAVSPDGRHVASGGEDGARLWDLEKSAESHSLFGIKGRVNAIAFGPKGKIVASAATDAVYLWDQNGKQLHKMPGHKGPINALAFRPGAGKLWSAGNDGDVRIWNTSNGKEEVVFQPHKIPNPSPIHALAITVREGVCYFATGGDDLVVRFGAEKAPTLTIELHGHVARIHALAFSPDALTLASGGADETVRLWSTKSGAVKQILSGQDGIVRSVAFSSDSRTLAVGMRLLETGKDQPAGAVKFWDVASGKLLRTILLANPILSLGYFDDGRLAVSDGNNVEILRDALPPHAAPVLAIAISPDARIIASGDQDRTIRLSDAVTGVTRQTLKGHAGAVNSVVFRPGGAELVSMGSDGAIRLWESAGGALRREIDAHPGGGNCLAFAPDGALLASGGKDRLIRLWGPAMEPKKTLEGHADAVSCVAFAPDGLTLASGSVDGSLKLWNSSDGTLVRTLRETGPGVQSVVFLANGKTLAAGGLDGTVTLWDTVSGEIKRTLKGHLGAVWALALSADGKTLAAGAGTKPGTAGAHGEVRLWDPIAGRLRAVLSGQSQAVTAIAFAADGSILVSGSWDKSVKVFSAGR